MPDWKMFMIDASWVSGMEKVREYWTKAWTSPMLMAPLATRRPADDGHEHVLHVAEEHGRRLHEAGHELGAEGGLVQLVVLLPEPCLDLVLAAEGLHDGVAGEGLLDLGVELPGAPPLGDELGRARAAILRMANTDTGTVVRATTASSGEMVNIMMATPMSSRIDVSIWLRVCCRLWAMLSMSLVTRLSRSPRDSWSM